MSAVTSIFCLQNKEKTEFFEDNLMETVRQFFLPKALDLFP